MSPKRYPTSEDPPEPETAAEHAAEQSYALQVRRVTNQRLVSECVCAVDHDALVERHLLHAAGGAVIAEDWVVVCTRCGQSEHFIERGVALELEAGEALLKLVPLDTETRAVRKRALFGDD